jgi:hypothetical protein
LFRPVPFANTKYAADSFMPQAVTLAQMRASIAKKPPFEGATAVICARPEDADAYSLR